MSIKRGDVVSHCGASQWGVGKVNEICGNWVAILFNDGITRKIVKSHLGDLHPADPRSFVPVTVELKPAQRTTLPKEKKAPRKRAVKTA